MQIETVYLTCNVPSETGSLTSFVQSETVSLTSVQIDTFSLNSPVQTVRLFLFLSCAE